MFMCKPEGWYLKAVTVHTGWFLLQQLHPVSADSYYQGQSKVPWHTLLPLGVPRGQ